jgi:hypothetical protein
MFNPPVGLPIMNQMITVNSKNEEEDLNGILSKLQQGQSEDRWISRDAFKNEPAADYSSIQHMLLSEEEKDHLENEVVMTNLEKVRNRIGCCNCSDMTSLLLLLYLATGGNGRP